MTPIGGFFELELPPASTAFHPAATALTSGRACLRHLLRAVQPRRVHLPYYICDVVPAALDAERLDYCYYPVNENMDPAAIPDVAADEALIAVNYFGLKGTTVSNLAARFGPQLIVDDTQAFFQRGYPGSSSFNSARKFFGVPDGAYLYAAVPVPDVAARNDAPPWGHLVERLGGRQEIAYRQFQQAEADMGYEVRRVSVGSERMLAGFDYRRAIERRRANFLQYHECLAGWNQLPIALDGEAVPLCYPFLPAGRVPREALYARYVYPPCFWKECAARSSDGFAWERSLADRLLPLPSDQRYEAADIDRVVRVIRPLLGV